MPSGRPRVNSYLIRGIDRLAKERLPALVVLCTNRYGSLDPAVLRRAAISHEFKRPDDGQREALLRRAFGDVFGPEEYEQLVGRTGPGKAGYGYSFSDITQRLVPNMLLEAFPDGRVGFGTASSVLDGMDPTPPFGRRGGAGARQQG